MKIVRIDISDTFGTKEFHLEPGTVTFLRGDNGTGKSSILKALLYIFDGGADPGVIRRGAKKSVVRMVLDNGIKIEKATTPSGARLEITDAEGLVVPNPATFLKGLAESVAINPARLLKIDASTKPGKRQLIAELLETMPVEFTPEDVEAVAPLTESKPVMIQPSAMVALQKIRQTWPQGKVDLEGIDKYRKTLEESRRKVGQERDECNKGAEALSKSIPAVEDAETARARLREVETEIRLLDEAEKAQDRADSERFVGQERAAREQFQLALDELNKARRVVDAERLRKSREAHAPLAAEQSTLKEQIRVADEATGARKQIELMRQRYREHANAYDLFTDCLKLIDSAKNEKMEHLPIPGITFVDGDVLVDGTRWQDANTARLIEVAVQHAALRPGELNFMVEDDAEHLGMETKRALTDALTKAGFQIVYAEVTTDNPLTVETRDEQ